MNVTRIRALLFDFDGTLTRPGILDFENLRQTLGCPVDEPVLEWLAAQPAEQRRKGHETLDRFELEAARRSEPADGARKLIGFLHSAGIPFGVVTRNSRHAVETALDKFDFLSPDDLAFLLCRDEGVRPKPEPDAVLVAAARLEVEPAELLCVGDFRFDVEAGLKAGAPTAFISDRQEDERADFQLSRIDELIPILRLRLPLPEGKLPNDLLGPMLRRLATPIDSALIQGPGVGLDCALVQMKAEEKVLHLKSDPVTFATDAAARYAAVVNANDLAASGADPRWFMATLLFPMGSTPLEIESLLLELDHACGEVGFQLVGGHTEITGSVNKPVLIGGAVGTTPTGPASEKTPSRRGDRLIVSKPVAIEGTALMARQYPDALQEIGFSVDWIQSTARLLTDPGISILPEAFLAREHPGTRAMHDVTEGGIATAISEFSEALDCRFRVDRKTIPVLEQTARLCTALEIDPLGLIASGSLLICVAADAEESIKERLRDRGLSPATVGEVVGTGRGVEGDWPVFQGDEISRAFRRLEDVQSP